MYPDSLQVLVHFELVDWVILIGGRVVGTPTGTQATPAPAHLHTTQVTLALASLGRVHATLTRQISQTNLT